MLTFLPGPIVGIIACLLYVLNLVFLPLLLLLLAMAARFVPVTSWREKLSAFAHTRPSVWWIRVNDFIQWLTTKTIVEVHGSSQLHQEGWYLLVCNHQSWVDILLLESIFKKKIPMLKFFMKDTLKWLLLFAGLACWAMDFPFMKRYSASYLKKHPENKGKDLEATKKACVKFRDQPITIINFVEGTRLTPEKHARQNSPYKHLLKPKAGGMAFVLEAMEGILHEIINVTIIYPESNATFWRFACGKIKKVIIHYDVFPIPNEIIGDYYNDKQFRIHFQGWLNEFWRNKDMFIEDVLKKESA